jgi:hypothetical protein
MESVGKIFFRNNNCTKVTLFLNNQIISYFETMWFCGTPDDSLNLRREPPLPGKIACGSMWALSNYNSVAGRPTSFRCSFFGMWEHGIFLLGASSLKAKKVYATRTGEIWNRGRFWISDSTTVEMFHIWMPPPRFKTLRMPQMGFQAWRNWVWISLYSRI